MNKTVIFIGLTCIPCYCYGGECKPNVILFLTDDQGWGDIGIHGNSLIRTPTLDKMYAESAVLNQFYVSPLSAPSRASLLTGRYHLRTGVSSVQNGLENMRLEETTLADLFHAAGYVTGCFGKWHNGAYYPYTPNGRGFDEFLGFCCGHWANYFDPQLQHNEEIVKVPGYITDIFTNAAIDFIEKNSEKSFFCYIPYNAPHAPMQVPDEYFNHYAHLTAETPRDRDALASIYAMIENVDHNIQRVLECIEKNGIQKNTIVIFMSDNGPSFVKRYNGGMRGTKGQVHEGGIRVPCFIRWPDKIRSNIIEYPCAHIDILPTLMDLCNIQDYNTHFPIDGISLKNLLLEMGNGPKRDLFVHRLQNPSDSWASKKMIQPWMGGVRHDQYRFVLYKDRCMLFDIVKDSGETRDISNSNDSLSKILYSKYMNWFQDVSRGASIKPTIIPIGYDEALEVRIPATEGIMNGRLACYGYPNRNWVNNFISPDDSLSFDIEIIKDGIFEIWIEYSLARRTNATAITVKVGNRTIRTTPSIYEFSKVYSPDRVLRQEAYEMNWNREKIGVIQLKKGHYPLKLYAENIPDIESLKIMTLILRRL